MGRKHTNFEDFIASAKQLREEYNLSFQQLSAQTGIPVDHLAKMEKRGELPYWGALILLARFYNKKLKLEFIDR